MKRKLTAELSEWCLSKFPESAKRALALPYDFVQTRRADREFREKEIPQIEPAADRPDHIVCIVVDALRSDAIGAQTEFLSSLDGVQNAIAPSTWTFPAVSSILTGEYPHEHGAINRVPDYDTEGAVFPRKVPPHKVTLTELLAGAGYDTYGGFGHDTPFVALSGRFQTHALFHDHNREDEVINHYLDWISERTDSQTFAYIHLAGPHVPVDPPKRYWRKHDVDPDLPNIRMWDYENVVDPDTTVTEYRENRRRLYTASVDHVDDQIEGLYRRLTSEHGIDPVFLVTSDHGEAMWDNVRLDVDHFDGTGCVDHGGTPHEALTRIPLLAEGLDIPSDGGSISLIDIAPSILKLVGIGEHLETTGRPMQERDRSQRSLLVEGVYKKSEKKAVYRNGWKMITFDGSEIGIRLPEEEITHLPSSVRVKMRATLPDGMPRVQRNTAVSGVVAERLADLGYK